MSDLENVVTAMLQQGGSLEEFQNFVCTYDLQDDHFIQAVIHQLTEFSSTDTEHLDNYWGSEDDDDLLAFLASPEKAPGTMPCKVSVNYQTGCGKKLLRCQQCQKVFRLKRNLDQHDKGVHKKGDSFLS